MSNLRCRVAAVAAISACVAAAAAPSTPAGRTPKQIQADMTAVEQQIYQKHWPEGAQFDPLYREQMSAEYSSLYKSLEKLEGEYATAVPKAAVAMRHLVMMDDARLAFWGDADAKGRITAASGVADPATARDGKLAVDMFDWWSARGDAAAQAKVVDDVERMAKASPGSGAVADAVHKMLFTCPASVAIGQRLTADLTVTLGKTPLGKAYAATPNKIDEPLAIEGTQVNGRSFKSSAWAGKVVLVDFWATWCPPCREEIPHVAKMYQQYHDQGLEIIGVSSDNDKRELASFVKGHAEMPWPELFGSTAGWHPLTKKFGIYSIPTMYLIDRNGLLRTTEAREDMDKMIPQLLAESYAPPAPAVKSGTAARTPIRPMSTAN